MKRLLWIPTVGGLLAFGCSDPDTSSTPNPTGSLDASVVQAGAGAGASLSGAGGLGGAGSSAIAGSAGSSNAGTGNAGSGNAGSGGRGGSGGSGTSGMGAAGTAGMGAAGMHVAGSAGTAGMAGNDADSGMPDPGEAMACNPAFAAANKCNPPIVFMNEEADGDGAMFDQVIPDPVATMKDVVCRVCTLLYRDPAEVTRAPSMIRLRIYDFDGVANAGGGVISFSSRHIANYDEPDDARFEYVGVLLHETTHLYQFDDGGGALVEGMADFVRIRAGHHRLNRRQRGGAWTDPYTTSGFFFSWLAGPGGLQPDGRVPADPDIGWAINQQMKDSWSEQVFEERLGKSVDELWTEYQDAVF
jgi:hypothetical protein